MCTAFLPDRQCNMHLRRGREGGEIGSRKRYRSCVLRNTLYVMSWKCVSKRNIFLRSFFSPFHESRTLYTHPQRTSLKTQSQTLPVYIRYICFRPTHTYVIYIYIRGYYVHRSRGNVFGFRAHRSFDAEDTCV